MTRRSIATALSAILVALTVALQSPAVRAYEPCDGHTDNRCTATTAIVDDTATLHAQLAAASAQATAAADNLYYIPGAGGMWAVIFDDANGFPAVEDYVSGPPPANSVAIYP